jgi:hypothetical protein
VIRMTSTTPRWALRRIPAALSSHVDRVRLGHLPRERLDTMSGSLKPFSSLCRVEMP